MVVDLERMLDALHAPARGKKADESWSEYLKIWIYCMSEPRSSWNKFKEDDIMDADWVFIRYNTRK